MSAGHFFFLFRSWYVLWLMSRSPVHEYDGLGAFEQVILIFIGTASANVARYGQVAKAEHRWSQQRLMGSAAITLIVPLEVSGPDKSNCTTRDTVGARDSRRVAIHHEWPN